MSFIPNTIGKVAGFLPRTIGGAIGGVAGNVFTDVFSRPRREKPLPPQGQNDPRVMRSTSSPGYGKGSSSLSI